MPFSDAFIRFAREAGPHCRLRFAPTPSGYLHIGNALNFCFNWLVARLNGGKILLRIDDIDAERKRPEYVADVFESLEWLGLDYDEGPGISDGESRRLPITAGVDDFEKNWSQHHRLPQYFKLLDRLRVSGLLFPCGKSRRELAPFEGRYPPAFRRQNLDLDDPGVAWRITTPPGFPMPDFIVSRRDGLPAYQVASLCDDIQFQITHVIRGEDLMASTRAQQFLAESLGLSDFLHIRFLHHPLVTDATGVKLSKSAGADSLHAMREGGAGPKAVFRQAATLLELPACDSAAELLKRLRGRMH